MGEQEMNAGKQSCNGEPGIEARTSCFHKFMLDLRDFSLMMDRILFRRALGEFSEFLAEHASIMEFTTAEQAEWEQLLSAAIEQNNPMKLVDHFADICQFFRRYQEASWPPTPRRKMNAGKPSARANHRSR